MGFFSGGSSTSTSNAYSGLRGILSKNDLNTFASSVPTDYNFGMNFAKTRLQDTNPFQLDANGLTAPQLSAFKTLSDQLFSNNSGRYAARGFLSPESAGAVSGDALTQLAPQLMGQVFQNQLANEQTKADRFAQLKSLLDSSQGFLGGESHSTSTSKGGNMLGQALAGSIGDLTTAFGKGIMSGGAGGFKFF